MFLARVERLPVTSRSHVTDVTDKCKISIMMCCGVVVHHCGKLVSILVLIEWSTLSRSE